MKKKTLIATSIIVAILLIVSSIIGINIYNKNKEIKQREEDILFLKNQFDKSFEMYDEIQICDILKNVYDRYPDEFDAFVSTFESKTNELIKIREKDSADFLNRLYSKSFESDNNDILNLSKDLNRLIENNFENILLSQIKGQWKRQDSTDLSGTVITVNVNSESPAATITDVSNSVNNKNYFKIGDIKWNYISCVDKSVFVFTDMWKSGEYDIKPKQARGVYNYDTDTIDVSVGISGHSGSTTYNGLTQHWVRDNQPQ